MSIETVKYKLYSHWASTLINNDPSGLSDEDLKELDRWHDVQRKEFEAFYCVDCEDYGFGIPDNGGLAGDLSIFTFQTK